MVDKTLQDQKARDRIEKELQPNMVVLAGAGAGKTYELVERMASYVRQVGPEVERLAAITFTRKAAGEMRGRFFLRLRALHADAQGEEKKRLSEALGKIDQCFIGTIHSFCGQLLRERPLEAGLSPEFSEMDEREEVVLRRQVWDRFVQQRFEEGDARLQQLEEMGLRTEDLHTFFIRRCEFGDLPLKETRVAQPDLGPALEAAEGFVDLVEAHLPDPLVEGPDGFMAKFQQTQLFARYSSLDTIREQITWLQLLFSLGAIVLKRWEPERDFAKELRDDIYPDFRENYLEPVLRQWRQYVYGHVIDFIDEAVVYYETERHAAGQLTFQDLLLKATALLRNHPPVRRYFQNRYRCLFVDEFQDTDPIQAEMLFYLTGQDTDEKDWRKLDPRPGSLFIVGDEKQSIYRFRRADVETFRLAAQRLKETGGSIEELNTSFRSLGKLCEWINGTFEPLFERQEEQYQARFAPLFQYRTTDQDDGCVRKISIERVNRHNRKEIATQEAGRIAAFIQAGIKGETEFNQEGEGALLAPKANPGDFLILTYTRKHLPIYARALEERGIPYDISGGGKLSESPEVQALVNLLEVVYRPDNPLPLVSFLRGELVGMGDDELYDFHQAGGHFDYRRRLPEKLSPEQRERWGAVWDRLRQVQAWLRTKSPAVALELIAEDLGLASFASSGQMGSSRAGNLLRLLAMVRQWEGQGMHWGQVVEELSLLIEDPDYQVEEMTLESGQADVVRLMNLHQSKGLQGKVVFLVDSCDPTVDRSDVDFHVSRMGDAPFLSLPVQRPNGEFHKEIIAEPIGWEEDVEEERKFLQGEKLRLLYVAATRARNLLVVSCYEGKTAGSWAQLYPYLQDVPELRQYASVMGDGPGVALPDWQAEREDRIRRWDAVRKPTYVLRAVTEEVFEEDPQNEGKWGRGRDYGSFIHRLFEWAVKGALPDDEERLIRQQLLKVGLEEDLVDSAKKALDGFRASAIWQEVQESDAVYTEVPFAVPVDDGEGGKVLRGIIDLVYRVQGGWKIVDYKTGVHEKGLCEDKKIYWKQIDTYSRHWGMICNENVVEKGLWLADDNHWIAR
jgi:ATP-dependent helicase/nuclease subunit A